ncbi:KamA family radical SAM protein [Bacteroides thetaiotaomicron]|jgi:lysine 2,3-aminomutase|uniref:KamA family radical SAM protein n=1 Tax=Bacteroides thetaiotaomicron TaxID=818 RepID=UPI0018A0883B|nr:KamA family protein [Bacteroides thetaiotaomicron]MDC2130565.1 KamA family protein [Bacteroides thetaiotaomicron]MDC2135245.1 KamA family protein [Bacteroides thetaiotaomicron]MDC2139898.1 KamA family protein [Bacteroides thetaiotaomicron]MDC2144643.1 KamA family protein [Bacteroides thetaiotaomicron]MDC2149279.1 KamA family protein [Bacteroides thetaiotaomicron]
MKQKKMLVLTFSQLKQIYTQEMPELVEMAAVSPTVEDFKAGLLKHLDSCGMVNEVAEEAREQIRLLLQYDGQDVHELSTGQDISVQTIRLLYQFLTEKLENIEMPTDLFVELFQLFKRLQGESVPLPSPQRIKSRNDRWDTGLDEEVREMRDENKERMLHLLIQKIENRKSKPSVRFHFEEGMSYEEKYQLVSKWWGDFRFHLSMAVKSPAELNRFLGNSLSSETMYLLNRARKKGMPFFATPYYLSLLNVTGYGYNDEAIRSYILYSPRLVETYGNIRAWEKEDIVEAGKPNAAGWLLPDGHNIHRRYPEVAILIPDTMGRACGGLCASCQRMYDFQSERLNFEFETLRPKESWDSKLRRLMTYFEQDTQLRDILITGGDALMSQNKTLRNILEAVYRMAVRKQRANLERPEGEKYAELQRVRLGSRLLAYLPMRINDELVDILREFKEKASAVGVKQFIIQTHFQTPLEVTPEAKEAIRKILSAGWIITNQLVYTVAASRRGHTTRLRQVLNSLGVVCYYTFSVKGFNENYAVFAPNSRSMQEQQEEKIYGQMTPEQAEELYKILETKVSAGINEEKPKEDADTAKQIRRFMRKHHLPFLATDRSVLNLPAIGKSMTFQLVGLTEEGKRILRFEHDGTRHHSPIIDQMGQIYIVENKSLAAYLRQLSKMGEDPEDYASIWSYTKGETEPRFSLYEYPDFPFRITDKMSNLEISNK